MVRGTTSQPDWVMYRGLTPVVICDNMGTSFDVMEICIRRVPSLPSAVHGNNLAMNTLGRRLTTYLISLERVIGFS